jgi:hypothetical protein
LPVILTGCNLKLQRSCPRVIPAADLIGMSVAGTQLGSLRASSLESRRLALAFAVSIAAHLLVWGGYELGKELNLWHLPAWLHVAKKKQTPPPLQLTQNTQPPLVFVDVNPDQVSTETPKNARYYSDKNSTAANPDANDTDMVKFNGKQTDMVKTEDAPRPSFAKPQPAQQASEAQEETQPKPSMNPGDLTLGNPEDEQRQTQGEAAQPRPRTIKEALAQAHLLPGVQMRQDGGVHREALVPSLDVKATPFGAYDAAFIEAVTQHWYDLLDSHNFAMDRSGKVTVQFHLNYDGSITDVKVLDNNVGDVLGYICQEAVTEPAPYEKWPSDMRQMVGADYREISFTFYYY